MQTCNTPSIRLKRSYQTIRNSDNTFSNSLNTILPKPRLRIVNKNGVYVFMNPFRDLVIDTEPDKEDKGCMYDCADIDKDVSTSTTNLEDEISLSGSKVFNNKKIGQGDQLKASLQNIKALQRHEMKRTKHRW